MSDLVTRAQLTLLSRTLHVPVEQLVYLEKLGADNLHELQERMAKVIFAQHASIFSRVSMLVPIVPLSIAMPLVQRMVPAVVAGRAAGALGVAHPHKAAEATGMLAPAYAAAAAPYLDPHTVGQLAEFAPLGPVVEIVNEILRRGDYVTAGPFLAYATTELIRAVEQGAHDDEGLIRAASYSYSGANISMVVRLLLDGLGNRIPRMLTTIVRGPQELQLAAVSVFARCDADVVLGVGDVLFEVSSAQEIGDLVRSLITAGAVPEMLRFTGQLSRAALDLLGANAILTDLHVIDTVLAALADNTEVAVWRGLLELSERTEPSIIRRMGGKLSHYDPTALAALPEVLTTAQLWPPLLRLLAVAEPDAQSRIGESWSGLPVSERQELERRVTELGLDAALATFIATLQLSR